MPKSQKVRKLAKPYPWKEWFSLVKFTIYKGRDYDCQPHGMSAMIRNRAYQAGLYAKVLVQGGRIDVEIHKERLHA